MTKRSILAITLAGLLLPVCFGQTQEKADAPPAADTAAPPPDPQAAASPLPRFGVAVSVGTPGAGIEVGTAVAQHTNIRGGFNYFSYSLSGTRSSDNLSYSGTLRPLSGEVLLDQYLAGPFHVSGGALLYNGFQATGNVHVPGGDTFTLNGATYYSSTSDPVLGTGAITVRKIAPELMIGFGNLLPRSARHFTVNVDLGVVFQGSPSTKLNLSGSTCGSSGSGCSPISTNSAVQANITAEQTKINNDLKPFQYYPVIRISFGYKF
jgi:hypothetical protein